MFFALLEKDFLKYLRQSNNDVHRHQSARFALLIGISFHTVLEMSVNVKTQCGNCVSSLDLKSMTTMPFIEEEVMQWTNFESTFCVCVCAAFSLSLFRSNSLGESVVGHRSCSMTETFSKCTSDRRLQAHHLLMLETTRCLSNFRNDFQSHSYTVWPS